MDNEIANIINKLSPLRCSSNDRNAAIHQLEALVLRRVFDAKIDLLRNHVPFIMDKGEARSKMEMILQLTKEIKEKLDEK